MHTWDISTEPSHQVTAWIWSAPHTDIYKHVVIVRQAKHPCAKTGNYGLFSMFLYITICNVENRRSRHLMFSGMFNLLAKGWKCPPGSC